MKGTSRAWSAGLGAALILVACGGDDPVASAAEAICVAIDAEPDDVGAFEEFERMAARERRGGLDEDALLAAVDDRCGRALAAISLAATEEPQEPEGTTDPDPEQLVLLEVDWAKELWTTTCAVDDDLTVPDEPLPVSLRTADNADGFAWAHAHPDTPLPYFEVDVDGVLFKDVTGDGADEAVFEAACTPGNIVQPVLVVWTLGDGELQQLPEVHVGRDRAVVLDAFEAGDGSLRVYSREAAPGAPPADGYPVEVVTVWQFNGTEWTSEEVSRIDTSPPPPPEPEPEPEPGACERYGWDEMGYDDDDYCEHIQQRVECVPENPRGPDYEYVDGDGYFGWRNIHTGEWDCSGA